MSRRDCCGGKVRHRTREGAMITIRKARNKQLVPYACPSCGAWHIGNSNDQWRVQARIDQLLKRVTSPPLQEKEE